MQNFLSLWLNAGAQITHGGQVQRQNMQGKSCIMCKNVVCIFFCSDEAHKQIHFFGYAMYVSDMKILCLSA